MKWSLAILPFLAACSYSFMTDGSVAGPAGAAEAKVIVYRPSSANAAKAYAVYDGDRLMGFAESWRYFEYRCPPGEHLFMQLGSSGVTDTAVLANLEAGRTYYLRSDTQVELFELRLALTPVTPGSPEMQRMEEELDDCDCRQIVPENVEDFIEDQRERVAERLSHFRGVGETGCALLKPQDGVLEAGK